MARCGIDSKDDVFEVLSQLHHRDIRERIMPSLDGATEPLAQLEAINDAFMRWRAELGPMWRVLDQEAWTPGSRIARHRSEIMAAMGVQCCATQSRWAHEIDPILHQGLIAAEHRRCVVAKAPGVEIRDRALKADRPKDRCRRPRPVIPFPHRVRLMVDSARLRPG